MKFSPGKALSRAGAMNISSAKLTMAPVMEGAEKVHFDAKDKALAQDDKQQDPSQAGT